MTSQVSLDTCLLFKNVIIEKWHYKYCFASQTGNKSLKIKYN